jgi:hypothetical protein
MATEFTIVANIYFTYSDTYQEGGGGKKLIIPGILTADGRVTFFFLGKQKINNFF